MDYRKVKAAAARASSAVDVMSDVSRSLVLHWSAVKRVDGVETRYYDCNYDLMWLIHEIDMT